MLKPHGGVQTEFLRLTKDGARLDGKMRGFLSRTYNLKAIADYGTNVEVSAELATAAVQTGKRFVADIEVLASDPVRPAPGPR